MKNNLHISLTNIKNESRLFKTTKTLVSYGIADTVFIVGLWEEGLETKELLGESRYLDRIVLKSRGWSKNLFSQLFKYFEFSIRIIYKYKKQNIRFVTIHNLGLLPLGVVCKYIFDSKLIYDAHEYETQRKGLRGIRKKLSKIVEKKLIPFCDSVIVVNSSIANEYKRLYPGIEKLNIVLNVPFFNETVKLDKFREKFKIAENKIIFLYQGALSEGRGIDIILEVFKDLIETEAVVVFMGYGPFEEKIKLYQRRYKNIYFHEAVNPDILLDYTCSADFGIAIIENSCLSYYYSLPNKLFEYIMAEVPIIVSDLPEMKKIVFENKIGFVIKENSYEGLKSAITEALGTEKRNLIVNLEKVKNIYNWEAQEKNIIRAYDEL